ncbi:MAG: sulfotransferase [Alphaproteobacteria bacterium]|nr:sulfotransferase [Alphaproteobacteria bacterium]
MGPAQQSFETALALHRQGRLNDAERLYHATLKASPSHSGALQQLGVVCAQTGRFEEAVAYFARAVAVAANPGLCTAFGNALYRLGRYTDALDRYGQALSLDARFAEADVGRGSALLALGRSDEALAAFAKALALKPQLVEAVVNTGNIHLADGRGEEALAWFQRSARMRPNFPPALEGTGRAQLAIGRPADALVTFEQLLARDLGSAAAWSGKGNALEQLGRIVEARGAYERAASLSPNSPAYHYPLATIARFEEGDSRLVPLERLAERIESFPSAERIPLHFALAKAYDDLNRPALAFEHMQDGNRLRRASSRYDEAFEIGLMRAMADAFTAELMEAKAGTGHLGEEPVFVVGMPRSGTTLVEQILASHPQAFGAGEPMHLHRLIGMGHAGDNFPAGIVSVPNEQLRSLGALYTARLAAQAPGATRIVDKLPANFRLVGLIRLSLPKARIIHVRRDPMDTCLSCYAGLFAQNLDFSYDLGELGRYYRAYEALMAHWRKVLPQDAMLEVSYESMVEDFETWARRIVAYCGLPWDARCLAFHQTQRIVHTASASQVHQPLYRRAVGRAKAYEPWLGALREALRGS